MKGKIKERQIHSQGRGDGNKRSRGYKGLPRKIPCCSGSVSEKPSHERDALTVIFLFRTITFNILLIFCLLFYLETVFPSPHASFFKLKRTLKPFAQVSLITPLWGSRQAKTAFSFRKTKGF